MSEVKFEVGDIVEVNGVEGEVSVINAGEEYPVFVYFHSVSQYGYYLSDGRALSWHKEPSLKPISKKKKIVRMAPGLYQLDDNTYAISSRVFINKEHALQYSRTSSKLAIARSKLVKWPANDTMWVEVEE